MRVSLFDGALSAAREWAEETLGLFGGCGVNAAAVDLSARVMAEQLRTGSCSLEVVHELKVVSAGLSAPFCLQKMLPACEGRELLELTNGPSIHVAGKVPHVCCKDALY